MKLRIDKLFLYRHRFVIGYVLLGLAYVGILILLPLIAPGGISEAEMRSVVDSNRLFDNIVAGDPVDFVYHLLQKVSVHFLGLTIYAIKLPSIVVGFVTGILLIVLLNRWFKTNVALLASIITVLSPLFLFLAGWGTPAIMYPFWITLILWLGAKIVGEKRVSPFTFLGFVAAVVVSVYTPHLIYIAICIGLVALSRPHIRFTVKQTRLPQLIIALCLVVLFLAPLVVACVLRPTTVTEIFYTATPGNYFEGVVNAFTPFFSFSTAIESVFLAPLFGLATVALIVIGVIASMRVLFTSRNTAVSLLVIFAIVVSGFNQGAAVIIVVPMAILVAVGLESILNKWYSLFPTNPYARIFGVLPIATFTAIIVISGFIYTVFGYHYSPNVAREFNEDLSLVGEWVPGGATLLVDGEDTLERDVYGVLAGKMGFAVMEAVPVVEVESEGATEVAVADGCLASLGSWKTDLDLRLSRIITSSKSQNSDRLYLYNCN